MRAVSERPRWAPSAALSTSRNNAGSSSRLRNSSIACAGAAFRAHVNWQIENGTHGLVPVGTTGESPTLSHAEHKKVVEWCIDQGGGWYKGAYTTT